jgi:hypothetical protein
MLRTESYLDHFVAGPKVAATFWHSLTTKVSSRIKRIDMPSGSLLRDISFSVENSNYPG